MIWLLWLRVQAGQSEAEIQRMARNLTVAVAPDDFKAAADLEPQVGWPAQRYCLAACPAQRVTTPCKCKE